MEYPLDKGKRPTFQLPNGYKATVWIEPFCDTESMATIHGRIRSPQGKYCGSLDGYFYQFGTLEDCEASPCQEGFDFAKFLHEYKGRIPGLNGLGESLLEYHEVAYLTRLQVEKEHRGQKVGVTLLKKTTDYLLKNLGAEAVFWIVCPLREPETPRDEHNPSKKAIAALEEAYRRTIPDMGKVKGRNPYHFVHNPPGAA